MIKEAQWSVRKIRSIENGGRIFLPLWRMRRRRWEESIAQARAKREGRKFEMEPQPFNCLCGSINCLGDFLCKRVEKPKVVPTIRKRRSRTLTPREIALIDS